MIIVVRDLANAQFLLSAWGIQVTDIKSGVFERPDMCVIMMAI